MDARAFRTVLEKGLGVRPIARGARPEPDQRIAPCLGPSFFSPRRIEFCRELAQARCFRSRRCRPPGIRREPGVGRTRRDVADTDSLSGPTGQAGLSVGQVHELLGGTPRGLRRGGDAQLDRSAGGLLSLQCDRSRLDLLFSGVRRRCDCRSVCPNPPEVADLRNLIEVSGKAF
jgi:hypothetical protein